MESSQEKVLKLMSDKNFSAARNELSEWNKADIAALMENIEELDALKIFRLLPKDRAAEVFSFLPMQMQHEMIDSLTNEETAYIIENMYADDAADLLDEMPSNVVRRILATASSKTRTNINRLLEYPDGSAGAIMTVEYVALNEDWTAEEALDNIRHLENKSEDINVCYVITSTRVLSGIVSLRDMIFCEPSEKLKNIMDRRPIEIHAYDDQEKVAQVFQKYDFSVMPVVDSDGRMIGIITADDIMDVIEEEATEDMTKMAAIIPEKKPYSKTTVFDEVRRRAPWLMLLMLSATFTGAVISSFEDKLAKSLVLTAFIPMLMDTGGNAGGQSSTMIIRALSLNEITFKDFFKVLWKEFRVALCCGVILAVVNFAKMMIVERTTMLIGTVVCLTLVVTVICAKLIGTVLPILVNRLGFDPAVMANPIITTIVDAVSLIVYFRFAELLLKL